MSLHSPAHAQKEGEEGGLRVSSDWCIRPGSDTVLHMSRIKFIDWQN